MGAGQGTGIEQGTAEVRLAQVCALQPGSAQISAPQGGPQQAGAGEVGGVQPRPIQPRLAQVGSLQLATAQVDGAQVGMHQIGFGELTARAAALLQQAAEGPIPAQGLGPSPGNGDQTQQSRGQPEDGQPAKGGRHA